LVLEIAIVDVDELFLHEETIPYSLKSLVKDIERSGILKSPIIVDKSSLIVLDGMHRVKALQILGCKLICICLVDYLIPEIRVDRWCRVVTSPIDVEDFVSRFSNRGKIKRIQNYHSGFGENLILMFENENYEMEIQSKDIVSVFKTVSDIESWLRKTGKNVSFESEMDAIKMIENNKASFVFCPPTIKKKHVIEITKSGQIFPPKATRHIIPARPFGVDVPIRLLRDDSISIEQANLRLCKILRRKSLRHIPPGFKWGGRLYEEAIYLFE
jgi:hypothetical protein